MDRTAKALRHSLIKVLNQMQPDSYRTIMTVLTWNNLKTMSSDAKTFRPIRGAEYWRWSPLGNGKFLPKKVSCQSDGIFAPYAIKAITYLSVIFIYSIFS